jgi:hypothetical protein
MTAPVIAVSSLNTYYNSGSGIALQWQLTEQLATSSHEFEVSYSADGGSTWTFVHNVASANGAVVAGNFSTTVNIPSVNGTQYRFRVQLTDQAGNLGSGVSQLFTIDTVAPAITNVVLGNGGGYTATPVILATITANAAGTSPLSMIRYSESGVFADDNWVSFVTTLNVRLSSVNGAKDVYFWVKNEAGSVSPSYQQSITLDYGTPPVARFVTPDGSASYQTGDAVAISWHCESSVGLASSPIRRLEYTINDGVSFQTIATDLTNNESASQGSYDWVVPADVGTSPFRLKLICQSISEVEASVLSGYLNTNGWSLFAGGFWDMDTNVSASLANVGGGGSPISVTSDHLGNVYYIRGHAIMKMNAQSGFISTLAGARGTSGCSTDLSLSLLDFRFTSPALIGNRQGGKELIIRTCTRFYSYDTELNQISLIKDLDGYSFSYNRSFLSTDNILIFVHSQRLYKVDLSINDAPVEHIYGNGTCVARGDLEVGADVLTQGMPGRINSAQCPVDTYFLAASSNLDKIWINPYHATNATRIDKSGSGYVIGSKTLNWNLSEYAKCFGMQSYPNRVYCSGRWNGRSFLIFDTESGSGVTRTLPFENNLNTGYLAVGRAGANLVTHYSLNNLSIVEQNPSDTNVVFTTIAGRPLTSFGNGEELSMHAFTNILDIRYIPASNRLWLFGAGHSRIIDFSTPTSWTAFGGSPSTASGAFAANPAGTHVAYLNSCARRYVYSFSLIGSTVSSLGHFLGGACDVTSGQSYHLVDGDNHANAIFRQDELVGYASLILHSNGKSYFGSRTPSNQHIMLFASNRTILERIAGQEGAASYNAAHHGGLAKDASLTRINMIQENADGDLLILDGHRLRKITVTTESATPRIYDIFDFTSIAGYTVGWYGSAFYNESTETLYVFDSSTSSLKKAHATNGYQVYSTAGTAVASTSRITGNNTDIYLLDPPRQRVLRFGI